MTSDHYRTSAERTLAQIPVQWRREFYYWVVGMHRYAKHDDLYVGNPDAAVREFLGPTFDLIRLPVGV